MSEERNFRTLFQELAETSSLHGIPKIASSRQLAVKILWCILLIGTMTSFTIQLHGLFEEFYSYPTKTSVRLNFKSLAFPAMTFCNMNPAKFVNILNFSSLNNILAYRFLASFTDKMFDNETVDDDVFETHNNTRDQHETWKQRFLTEFRNLSAENRSNIGHQKEDFIHSALFSGYRIPIRAFKKVQNHMYGNCYTLDYDKLIARGSGLKNSLNIVFNIEVSDHVFEITSGNGVRMVFHEKGTYPLPEDEGLTLSSKTETYIGLRMSSIARLGGKYGKCTDGRKFKEKYKFKYSVKSCFSLCEIETLISHCQCLPISSLGMILDRENIRLCDFEDDEVCMKKVTDQIHTSTIQCECLSKCKENVYSTALSSRLWPNDFYLETVLLKEYCRRTINKTTWGFSCVKINDNDFLEDKELNEAASNFLSVYIYFEDLNYEAISEEPLYNKLRFLSDIGGAMGLYMGASILTYVEILQVALEVILLCKGKLMKIKPAEIHTKGANIADYENSS